MEVERTGVKISAGGDESYSGKLTAEIILSRSRTTDLETVTKLNCWGLNLTDVSIVRQLPNLESCSLSMNDITTLEDFSHCPNIQELYVRKNRITDLGEICHLKRLDKLQFLWLSDNPCTRDRNYRMNTLKNLPRLQKLDNVSVTEEELSRATVVGQELYLPNRSPAAKRPKVTLRNNGVNSQEVSTQSEARSSGLLNSCVKNQDVVKAILLLIDNLDSQSLRVVQDVIREKLKEDQ